MNPHIYDKITCDKNYSGKKTTSFSMAVEKLKKYLQNNETELLSYTKHKNQLKIHTIKPETIKLLEENISSELSDTGLADFSDIIPKAKARPAKISKGECLKKASTYYRKAAVKKKNACQ